MHKKGCRPVGMAALAKTVGLPTVPFMAATTIIRVAVVVHISRTIVPTATHPDIAGWAIDPISGGPNIIHPGAGGYRFH